MANVRYELLEIDKWYEKRGKKPVTTLNVRCPVYRATQPIAHCHKDAAHRPDGSPCKWLVGVSFDPLAVKCEFGVQQEGGDEDEQDTGT